MVMIESVRNLSGQEGGLAPAQVVKMRERG